jgi:hypothetical protein
MPTHVLSDAALGYYYGSSIQLTTDTRILQEAFCLLNNFLAGCSDTGVTRIASYYGAAQSNAYMTVTGTGFGTWDTGASAGTNAWVLYRFGSAVVPFYVLIQWCGMGIALGATGAPASYQVSTPTGACLVASFAYRPDGSSPWNGTTNNNGADTKGSLVWKSGSYIFPRSNSLYGTDVATASRMLVMLGVTNLITHASTPHVRMYVVLDEDNFIVTFDIASSVNTSREAFQAMTYFGKFTPMQDMFYSSQPYWCMTDGNYANVLGNKFGNSYVFGQKTFAGTDGYTNNPNMEGGIAHPSVLSGTVGYSIDTPGWSMMQNVYTNPGPEYTTTTSATTGSFTETPLLLIMNEASSVSGFTGLVGYSDWLRTIFGVMPYTTLNNKTRIAIGPAPFSIKYTVPWSSGSYAPGTNISRVPSIT